MSRIVADMPTSRQVPLGAVPVIAVAGVAGSGKTTLGRALAAELGLPILDLDQLTNPLLDRLHATAMGPHWLSGADAVAVRDGRYAALRAAAADIVGIGVGVVLVAPFTAELTGGAPWGVLCSAVAPARVDVVHLDGSPELVRARRQQRGEPRDALRADDCPARPPAVPHVRVDAALSTHQQLFRALRALGRRTRIDPSNPLFGAEFDAVLFDLDGTLVDSTPAIVRSWNRLADEFGFDPSAVQANHGRTAAHLLSRVLAPRLVPQAHSRITQLEASDTAGVTALPGAAALLAALPDHAKAIVTSGGRDVAGARIAAAALPPVGVVVTADDVRRAKPDPEPYLVAARRLGVPPARCLVVEDAPAGVSSAQLAGCSVLAVGGTCEPGDLDAGLWLDGLDRVRVVPRGSGFGLEPAQT